MRLTLRTLLAYLDDMLDDEDANALKVKIDESGIATNLITRIRNSVDNRDLGAISPDAIGPLENANVMSEYLDSTLSPEQIAEIERLCLESDTSLSEAAACHQILTVVLGQPAQVSERLRQRIYTLPNSEALQAMEQQSQPAADTHSAKPIVASGPVTYAGIDIPPTAVNNAPKNSGKESATPLESNYSLANASAADLDRGAADFDRDAATAIRPVEPKDSGVAKASAKLRNTSGRENYAGRSEAEIVAGTTRAMMGRSEGYAGGIRTSRMTPWLVALALAGVLLYALGQVFSPLTGPDMRGESAVAQRETKQAVQPVAKSAPQASKSDPIVNAADSAGVVAVEPEGRAIPVDDVDTTGPPINGLTSSEELSAAESAPGGVVPAADPSSLPGMESATQTLPLPATMESAVPQPTVANPPETDPVGTVPAVSAPAEVAPADNETPDSVDMADMDLSLDMGEEVTIPGDEPESMRTSDDLDADVEAELALDESQSGELAPQPAASVVAEMTQPGNLVIVRQGGLWKRLTVRELPDEPGAAPEVEPAPGATVAANPEPTASMLTTNNVGAGQTIVAPALFRPTLVNPDGIEWTLAGPTRLKIGHSGDGAVTQILDGRILLSSTQPELTTTLILGQRQIRVVMPESQTVLAIELTHFRPLGADPLVPTNRMPEYRVISVQGTIMIQALPVAGEPNSASSESVTLESNQQYQGKGIQPAMITPVDRLPAWIDADAQKDVLADSARDGLMEFTTRDEPIEKSLREAMTFRRVEVAALAAETLLLLGRADVYFGGDGILNRPRQRLYWEEHVVMLRQHIASDAAAAEAVRVAIERAELADSMRLFKLLIGFTQEELAAGADAELVSLLDSPSMAVRVLAIENLREIVGDTLAYRADQENANTRKSDIKKWETRLRRGDIRYQQ